MGNKTSKSCALCLVAINNSKGQSSLNKSEAGQAKENIQRKINVLCTGVTKELESLHQEHVLLERVVIDFWKTIPKVTVINELIDDENESMLANLHESLLERVERVKNCSDKDGVHLIPGGGKMLIRLQPAHLPRLQRLTAHVSKSHRAAKMKRKLREIGFI